MQQNKIAFVGSMPVQGTHIAFTGRPGVVLDRILANVSIDRTQHLSTNVLDEYTDLPHPPVHREPLANKLHQFAPELIITFGDLACATLTNHELKNVRGYPMWSSEFNCYILCTYQPASVFYGTGATIHDLCRDLEKIPLILAWPPVHANKLIKYQVVATQAEAQGVLNSLTDQCRWALDIETTNPDIDEIDAFSDQLICLAIADTTQAWVMPASVCGGLDWPTNLQWTFHNGQFDTQGIRKYLGVWLPIVHDTMLMSYALDERSGRHGLKMLSREYLGADKYAEGVRVGSANLTVEQAAQVYEYNAKDAVYTARLAQSFIPRMAADNVETIYRQLLIPAANLYKQTQLYGARIDFKIIRSLVEQWIPELSGLEGQLQADAINAGFESLINLRSPKQLNHLFYDLMALPGERSTNKARLAELEDFNPFISKLRTYREIEHVVNHFIVGIIDDVKVDGRVHASVLIHGTVTGRPAYRKPPLQTIPKPRTNNTERDMRFIRLREMFVPSDPEHLLIEADYEKAEVWCGQYLSGDEQLLADLQSKDFHRNVASQVYKVPFEQVTELQRFRSKYVTFGIMYGITEYTLSKQMDCAVPEAKEFLELWYERYPRYRQWFNDTLELVQAEGELQSTTGRKRRFKIFVGNNYDLLNQAVNFPVQSLSSDCTLSSAIELQPLLMQYNSHILWTVHDAIVIDVCREHLDTVKQLVNSVMSKPRFAGMPGIPVEIKVGDRLSNVH